MPSILQRDLFGSLLRDVSRSFYLTLRVLPKNIRLPIGLAYLLARAADSIADTEVLPHHKRLEHLIRFRRLVTDSFSDDTNISKITQELESIISSIHCEETLQSTPKSGSQAEMRLLLHLPECFELFRSLKSEDRVRISEVIVELTTGMELDLRRFDKSKGLDTLETFEELEDYTYHVAGCVGPFWTKICMAYFPEFRAPFDSWDTARMCPLSIQFGKALQWTNILRDLPRDLQNGRCYLPSTELSRLGLSPTDLRNPNTYEKLKPLYFHYIAHALEHYKAAWKYTLAIPRSCTRIRLACIWPIWIGLKTLSLLCQSGRNPLDPHQNIRASRFQVYTMMITSILCVKFDRKLNAQYQKYIGHVRKLRTGALQ